MSVDVHHWKTEGLNAHVLLSLSLKPMESSVRLDAFLTRRVNITLKMYRSL